MLIVLTGCTRGLGLALTREFKKSGHTLVGCGRAGDRIRELSARYPEDAFQIVDVTDFHAVQKWAGEAIRNFGPPDLLINNAAMINRCAPLWEVDPDEFSRLIDINLKGVFHTIKAFLPAMIERKRGIVVNFSSGWGRSTSPEVAPYCCSKWGVEGLTRALAQELPSGLAAIPLNPGVINTKMLQSCFGEQADAYPDPESWAVGAAKKITSLGPQHNGQALSVG